MPKPTNHYSVILSILRRMLYPGYLQQYRTSYSTRVISSSTRLLEVDEPDHKIVPKVIIDFYDNSGKFKKARDIGKLKTISELTRQKLLTAAPDPSRRFLALSQGPSDLP